ncbi:glycosyl transferase group 1 [Thalassoporum mexicanum PCC 7367]|uniref:glycosyltransferase family 4 protein n=1 Tax=Thalassoporum mexicanum TaxID=3457544 RepID=UPI00029F98D0|nr:glycosyltransferase family 4 protein [Pseudanabaena sp. PCC 7367]AFY69872.1 glycosyl transferase group 1 [Pseudanabaena sp. PCC 7367]
MNIIALAWEFPPRIIGGLSRHVAALYPELVKLGHKIHLITVEVSGAPAYEVVDGVVVHRVAVEPSDDFFHWVANMNKSMAKHALQLIGEFAFDIIHAHDWLVTDAVITIVEQLQLPIVVTIHATEHGRWNGIHNDTQRFVNSKEMKITAIAQNVIVCTNYMRDEVERALHCDRQKISVIYNGLSQKRIEKAQQARAQTFDRQALRQKYAQPDECIVYYVGRLTYEKGIFMLLNAAPKILAVTQDKVKFVIIGSGEAYSILLKRQAWDLGIYHKVIFTGFMADEDLYKFQTIADCAVFPSLYEPFGIVALESFAAAVPTVVSDTGGLPEVVRDGKTGVITHTNDSESLARGILKVLQDREFRSSLIENAKQELHDRFTWSKLAQQTEAVYKKACLPITRVY